MRALLILGLLAATVPAEDDWTTLEGEWTAALDRFEKAATRARSAKARARMRHPFTNFAPRLRAYALRYSNTPEAAPAVVAILVHTRDPQERRNAILTLRENHLRSRHMAKAIPTLTRLDDAGALELLRMLAQDSPHEEIRARAKRAADEVKLLAVGKQAPVISGRDAAAQVFSLSDYRGKVVLLVIRNSPRVREYETLLRRLEERGLVVLGILTEGAVWRTWRKGEPLAARWNALERARHYVIDREGVIRGKDLLPDDLKRLLNQLLET